MQVKSCANDTCLFDYPYCWLWEEVSKLSLSEAHKCDYLRICELLYSPDETLEVSEQGAAYTPVYRIERSDLSWLLQVTDRFVKADSKLGRWVGQVLYLLLHNTALDFWGTPNGSDALYRLHQIVQKPSASSLDFHELVKATQTPTLLLRNVSDAVRKRTGYLQLLHLRIQSLKEVLQGPEFFGSEQMARSLAVELWGAGKEFSLTKGKALQIAPQSSSPFDAVALTLHSLIESKVDIHARLKVRGWATLLASATGSLAESPEPQPSCEAH